jgi:hypothetical protein
MHGIKRQPSLQSLEQVNEKEAHQAYSEQRCGVLRPALLGVYPRAREAIDQAFHWAQQRTQDRPLALEDAKHVSSKRFRQREDQEKVNGDLKPAQLCHDKPLEALRAQKRIKQIAKDQHSGDESDRIFHALTSQTLAGLGHSPTGDKEHHRDHDVEQVKHDSSLEIHEDDFIAANPGHRRYGGTHKEGIKKGSKNRYTLEGNEKR